MGIIHIALAASIAVFLFPIQALAGTGDTSWMSQGKYRIFPHYQYRILLGYSIKTQPQFPNPSQMTAEGWNRFVDGFDVEGFARQMAESKVGWVIFCLDDHYFAWPCAPNKAFSDYTGYAPGEKCSRRDLIMDVADALNARGVKLICYFAGLNGYMKEPKVLAGLSDAVSRGQFNDKSPPSDECRKRRLAILKEYADRYKDKVAGWWFDGMGLDMYQARPDDWGRIESIVHTANPKAIIAFSYGDNEQACLCKGIDDYTGGDTWSKQDLKQLAPQLLPPQEGILWHGKISCGNVYYGQGDDNQFSDQELINWINTCNRQGGVCTLDWPFDPKTGLLKDFGIAQLKRIAHAVKADEQVPQRHAYEPTWESLDRRPVAPWWRDAKFGVYIHWTLASVPGWGNHSSFYWPNLLKSRQMEANGHRPAKNDIAEEYVGLWQSREFLAWLFNESPAPEIVVNDRWGQGCRHKHGGFYTTEFTPGMKDGSHRWEENRTVTKPRAYDAEDRPLWYDWVFNRQLTQENFYSARELVRTLVDIVSRGGNLLLNVGPAVLKDVRPSGQTVVTMLGREEPLHWMPIEGGLTVEVPPVSVDEMPCEHAYTIRLTHVEGTSAAMGVRPAGRGMKP